MFLLPAYLSLLLDACLVVVYFNDPTVLGEDQRKPFSNPWDPLRSYLVLSIFAACRIVLYLPYVWSYNRDRRLRMPSLPYVWHLANIVLLAIKAIDNLIVNEQNGFQWLFLLFAAVSILCQCVGLNHLKSTAIPEREVVLGIAAEAGGVSDGDDTRVALLGGSGVPTTDRQYSSDLIVSMRKRMEEANERWNQGISKFNQYVGIFNQDEFGPVFKHVVDLFRGSPPGEAPVLALQALLHDHLNELEFYIPQITIFLLYGSFQNSEILQQFVLDLCAQSPTMAHKIRWFVRSFCLSGAGVGSVGVNTLNQFLSSVEKCGEASARQLMAALGEADGARGLSVDAKQGGCKSDHSSSAGDAQTLVSVPLSFRISVDAPFHAADRKDQAYPIHRTLEIIHQPEGGPACIDAFSPTFAFWDELVEISRELCPLAREVRTPTLKNKLDAFKNRYLPSASIFAPVGRTQHRVFNIQVEECFAFSTRERAPVFLCLEVVDYSTKQRDREDDGDKKWWMVPELGIKKSLKKAMDTFADGNSTQTTPGRKNGKQFGVTAGGSPSGEQHAHPATASSPFKTNKPVLGDRVMSETLLADLVSGEDDLRLHPDGLRDFGYPRGDWEQHPADIEAPSSPPVQAQPRGNSLPTRDAGMHRGLSEGFEDEVGQWALPSIPKAMLDRRPSEPVKKGFKQGLTRWFSSAGASLSRQTAPFAENSGRAEQQYQDIADDLPRRTDSDVDVHIYSESMRAAPPGGESDSNPASTEGSVGGGYGSLKYKDRSVSADAKVPHRRQKEKDIPIDIEDEIADPRTSCDGDHRLGQYRATTVQSGDASALSSSQFSAASQPLVVFKEPWATKERRVRQKSSVGHLPGWRLFPVIIKSGDDLRQEQIVSQLMFQIYFILQTRKVGCWLRPYGIIATSPDSGIIEAIPDTVSLDVLRRRVPAYTSLIDFYERFYGDRTSELFEAARDNFVKSLAGYSIICYLLQLKDRHNGNILLDNKGHLMHIDFGFVLGITPGGNMGFEKAPFKLTREMIELMGGTNSASFRKYRDLCVKTFMALRKEHHRIVLLLEMLSRGSSHLPCFSGNPQATLESLKERFCTDLNDNAAMERVHDLINAAANNWTTTCYDRYQRCCTGVF